MAADAPTVAFTISHPHDVHLFRHAIATLDDEGYRTPVFVREKEMTSHLLSAFDIPHTVLAGDHASKTGLVRSWSTFGYRLFGEARRIQPDLMVAEVGAITSPVSRLVGTDSLIFMDAEHASLQNRLVFPFATRICTSTSFWTDIGPKQVRYDGYQELAYLHPDRFDPDPTVLTDSGIDPDDPLVVVRAVGWNAAHDINAGGFDRLDAVIAELNATGATVVVSSEVELPDRLQPYRLTVEPHRLHDLLYYADLYVGESATMATESAVLGTPAVYVSTLDVGYTSDIAENYGLLFHYHDDDRQRRALDKATAILDGSDTTDWDARLRHLLADKRDTTDVILEQIRDMTAEPEPKPKVVR